MSAHNCTDCHRQQIKPALKPSAFHSRDRPLYYRDCQIFQQFFVFSLFFRQSKSKIAGSQTALISRKLKVGLRYRMGWIRPFHAECGNTVLCRIFNGPYDGVVVLCGVFSFTTEKHKTSHTAQQQSYHSFQVHFSPSRIFTFFICLTILSGCSIAPSFRCRSRPAAAHTAPEAHCRSEA